MLLPDIILDYRTLPQDSTLFFAVAARGIMGLWHAKQRLPDHFVRIRAIVGKVLALIQTSKPPGAGGLMKDTLGYVALVFGVVAAGFGIRAATVHVRDDMDAFIGDLHRQSLWASWAATMAACSAILQAIEKFLWMGTRC
jgi:hypothetical protein